MVRIGYNQEYHSKLELIDRWPSVEWSPIYKTVVRACARNACYRDQSLDTYCGVYRVGWGQWGGGASTCLETRSVVGACKLIPPVKNTQNALNMLNIYYLYIIFHTYVYLNANLIALSPCFYYWVMPFHLNLFGQ